MNNKNSPHVQKVIFLAGLLSAWSMAAVFALMYFNPKAGLLGVLFNILIVVMVLANFFPNASWVSLIFSILLYTIINFFLFGFNHDFLITSIGGLCIFLLTLLLSNFFKNQADSLDEHFYQQSLIIESLKVHDQNTGLMKWHFAKRALVSEIMRSQRYHGELSLILFEIQQKSHYSLEKIQRIEQTLSEIIQDVIRVDVDIPFIGDHIGLILPERHLLYTQTFTDQLIKILQNNIDAHISTGIANYPQDADNAQTLMDRAKAALRIALSSGQSIFLFQALGEDQGRKKEEKTSESSQEITKPVKIRGKRSPYQDYAKILKNISLNKDEWFVWLKGFTTMEDLLTSDHNLLAIEHISHASFLFVQGEHLVLKIKTHLPNLDELQAPFPGWVIQKVDRENHTLLLSQL
jgi:GGDEF domain-containing protein